jgi:hypothetical protein
MNGQDADCKRRIAAQRKFDQGSAVGNIIFTSIPSYPRYNSVPSPLAKNS